VRRLVAETTFHGVERGLMAAEARERGRAKRMTPPVTSIEIGQGLAEEVDLVVAVLLE